MPALPPPPPVLIAQQPLPPAEPDGSRRVGGLRPVRPAQPPPGWLREASHGAAAVDCRHYMYEAYALEGRYLARYVMLPEGNEAYREIEQVFLIEADPRRKPTALQASEVQFDPESARWQGRTWTLVDRRELMKP